MLGKAASVALWVTDGLYESKKLTVKGRQPYAIAMADGGMMVMVAGLREGWKDLKSGNEVPSCTILTCWPNDVGNAVGDLAGGQALA
jgi:putative SOS response-associated peptidase YedK